MRFGVFWRTKFLVIFSVRFIASLGIFSVFNIFRTLKSKYNSWNSWNVRKILQDPVRIIIFATFLQVKHFSCNLEGFLQEFYKVLFPNNSLQDSFKTIGYVGSLARNSCILQVIVKRPREIFKDSSRFLAILQDCLQASLKISQEFVFLLTREILQVLARNKFSVLWGA